MNASPTLSTAALPSTRIAYEVRQPNGKVWMAVLYYPMALEIANHPGNAFYGPFTIHVVKAG